jgi:hypothetical protein
LAHFSKKWHLAPIAYALAEGRVIFTQDDDFLRHHHAGIPHAGIVYSKQGSRSIGEIVCYLKLMNDCLDVEDMLQQGIFATVSSVRVRVGQMLPSRSPSNRPPSLRDRA